MLTGIDADINTAGSNNAFDFIGSSQFNSIAGELRFAILTGAGGVRTVISADLDGDGDADFSITLSGASSQLIAADFDL